MMATVQEAIIETEYIFTVRHDVKINFGQTGEKSFRSGSAWQHVVVKLDDEQRKSIHPIRAPSEEVVFSSFNVNFTYKWDCGFVDLGFDYFRSGEDRNFDRPFCNDAESPVAASGVT